MTTPTVGPALTKRILANQLIELRKSAGLRTMDVARARRCSAAHISQLEHAKHPPNPEDLEFLCHLYGAAEQFPTLDMLRDAAHKEDWLSGYDLPDWLKAYLGLESDAVEIRRVTLEVVPGLLQTEGYARQIFLVHTDQDADRRVMNRMQRRRNLIDRGAHLSCVISEAALARTAHLGTAGVEQLEFLRGASKDTWLTLRVLPFDRGIHRSITAGFSLLYFPGNQYPPVAYYEHAAGNALNETKGVVEKLEVVYDEVSAITLDPEGSAREIDFYVQEAKEMTNDVVSH